jgi:hypothetical protein
LPAARLAVFLANGKPTRRLSCRSRGRVGAAPMGWSRMSRRSVVYIVGEGAFGLRNGRNYSASMTIAMISRFIYQRTDQPRHRSERLAGPDQAIRAAGDETPPLIVSTRLTAPWAEAAKTARVCRRSPMPPALSDMFSCLVLAVHHQGASDDKRPRGHTTLPASAVVTFRSVKIDVAAAILRPDLTRRWDAASGCTAHHLWRFRSR